MIKKTLLAAAFAAASCVPAFAAHTGVSISQDKRVVFAQPVTGGKHAVKLNLPKKSATIYSNLASLYPNGLYFSGEGWTLCGADCGLGESIAVAAPFTPSAGATAKSISAAVGYIEGTDEITISLYPDAGGVPGSTALASGVASTLPTFGTCCDLATVKLGKGVALTAGTQYWVVVSTDAKETTTFAAWNESTVDQVDASTFAFNDNNAGWTATTTTTPPAFGVFSK